MPSKCILASVQLVAVSFHNNVAASKKIQKQLFLAADVKTQDKYVVDVENQAIIRVQKGQEKYIKEVETSVEVTNTKPNDMLFSVCLGGTPIDRATDPDPIAHFLPIPRAGGQSSESYRNMYLSQPPVKKVLLNVFFRNPKSPRIIHDISDPAGIKFGQLLDVFEKSTKEINFNRTSVAFLDTWMLEPHERADIAVTGKRRYQSVGPFWPMDGLEELEYYEKENKNREEGW